MKARDFSFNTEAPAVRGHRRKGARGFSLIEILVTVALLAFIILGLLGMFIQTQKAFRGSMKQTDVLGAGRAVMDMMSRDIAQMTPSQMAYTINFSTEIPPGPFQTPPNTAGPINSPPWSEVGVASGTTYPPITQKLPGGSALRTNVIQRVFFLTLVNQDWYGTGYEVVADYPSGAANSGVGTLYRYTRSGRNSDVGNLWTWFANEAVTNAQYFSKIADGVVYFRVRPFAANGFPIKQQPAPPYPNSPTNIAFRTSLDLIGTNLVRNTSGVWDASVANEVDCYFYSNAVPASVELELGVLEPNIFERFKSLSGVPAGNYLGDHVANVHVFRQRIPIRNVDFTAYQ